MFRGVVGVGALKRTRRVQVEINRAWAIEAFRLEPEGAPSGSIAFSKSISPELQPFDTPTGTKFR